MSAWIYRHRSILATGALMLIVVCLSVGLMGFVYRLEEERAFRRLHEAAADLSGDIVQLVTRDQEQLTVVADLIARLDDIKSDEAAQLLARYESHGMIARLGVLYPGDTLLLSSGRLMDTGGALSFEEEAAKGVHISDREQDLVNPDEMILRVCVPVRREGETAAMLLGAIDLSSLPELWRPEAFEGRASIYVVDGATGETLVDTWHGSLGNFLEMGTREMKAGFTQDQLTEEMMAGKPGYVAFVSRTIGDYLYLYYEPVPVNQWRIALSVPEQVVFEDAFRIRGYFYVFLGLELVLFLAYLLWILRYVRQETREKQQRLDMVNDIYEVNKLLFAAHRRPDQLERALEHVAGMAAARAAFFAARWEGGEQSLFLGGADTRRLEEALGERDGEALFRACFQPGGGMLIFGEGEAARAGGEVRALFQAAGLTSLIATPVEDTGGAPVGVLGVVNTRVYWERADLLKSVSFSFSMFYRNMRAYLLSKRMGEVDALTGLRNRNSFEQDLELYQQPGDTALACVYLDADGLHELNNRQGHAAGDAMLRTVAQAICGQFGQARSYRIGGDEFLAFVVGGSREEAERRARAVEQAAQAAGYHVSAGVSWTGRAAPVTQLVQEAEQQMYRRKDEYYAAAGTDRTRRQ